MTRYKIFFLIFLDVFICMSVLPACKSVSHVVYSAYGGHKRTSVSLEPELQVFVSLHMNARTHV